jgi:NAD(P)-dependent dehydrogenase (short-subunit alcohol dehydrogenase family)
MQTALPALKARAGGRIINFYPIDAENGNRVRGEYNTATGGVQALTRTASADTSSSSMRRGDRRVAAPEPMVDNNPSWPGRCR